MEPVTVAESILSDTPTADFDFGILPFSGTKQFEQINDRVRHYGRTACMFLQHKLILSCDPRRICNCWINNFVGDIHVGVGHIAPSRWHSSIPGAL
jgi:hypothetical protein